MFPEFTARTEFPRAAHPGTVTFVSADGAEHAEPADQIPDWLKFAPGSDGLPVPVVRVVRVSNGSGFGLRSYGPDGRLLWVTLPATAAPVEVAPRRPARELATTGWF